MFMIIKHFHISNSLCLSFTSFDVCFNSINYMLVKYFNTCNQTLLQEYTMQSSLKHLFVCNNWSVL